MKKWTALVMIAIGSLACDGSERAGNIPAGETARGLGVDAYRTERIGELGIIHIIGKNGRWMGDLELRSLEPGEIGFEDSVLTDHDVARFPYVRVRFKNEKIDRDVATFTGPERPGYDCPVSFTPPTVRVENEWAAALTDRALAPFLSQFELAIEPYAPTNLVELPEVPFDGFPHVGDCAGHRVLDFGSGYNYIGCSTSGADQTIQNQTSGTPVYWCDVTRFCYGGSASPGNGVNNSVGGSCCNGNNCSHPVPSGPSTQADCTLIPASGNGCKTTGQTCGCIPTQCVGPDNCYNDCGEVGNCNCN